MSEVKLKPTGGGAGSISLKAPAATTGNADFPLVLPADDGSADQYLKTDGSGALSWATVAVGGATGTDYNDSVKVRLGTGNDLEIYHDGSNSYIEAISTGAGDLVVQGTGKKVKLRAKSGEDGLIVIDDGAVELYYDNSKKFWTVGNGVRVGDAGDVYCEFYSTDTSTLRGAIYTDSSGNMGFLKTGGQWRLQIDDSGNYTFAGSDQSDRDKKDNIATITGTSLDKITKLVPKTYTWKDLDGKTDSSRTFTGFIAQEVKEHLPSLVTGTDGQKDMAVEYKGILAHAVKAITELSTEVETLKAKVATLEAG